MEEWQEPDDSPLRVIRSAASRLLKPWSPRGPGDSGLGPALVHAGHALRRIAFRTRGVILVSIGKSGRTWLRVMLDHLGIYIQYTHVGGRLEVPRTLNGRLIHLHRDPRDTIVSAWYQHRKRRGDYSGTLAEFLRDPAMGLEARVGFNLFWAEHVSRSGGLVTSYERLHADTAAELGRIVAFITGAAMSEARLVEAVAAGSFERMRALEASGEGARLYGPALAPGDPHDPDTYKTREGRIGAWRIHFSPADSAFAEALLNERDYFRRMRDATA